MNVEKITSKVTVRPTNKKMRDTKQVISDASGLPKEMPIEKKVYIQTMSNKFASIRDGIKIAIDKMRGLK